MYGASYAYRYAALRAICREGLIPGIRDETTSVVSVPEYHCFPRWRAHLRVACLPGIAVAPESRLAPWSLIPDYAIVLEFIIM